MSNEKHIMDAAVSGGLILTSNQRLSRHLTAAFDQQMQEAGMDAWDSPSIYSFDSWLMRCLAELGEDWRLLNEAQSLRLWETIIEQDVARHDLELLQMGATAKKAQQAHRLTLSYGCVSHDHPMTEDQEAFQRWQRSYVEACQDQQWLDRGDLAGCVYAAIKDGRLSIPLSISFAGFDQWNPDLEALRSLISREGGETYICVMGMTENGAPHQFPCADAGHEIEQAALWARNLLDAGETSIGVVVFDLADRRNQVERIFRNQIDPASALHLHEEDSAFTLSLGAPLLDQSPIHAALEILTTSYRVPIEKISFLLRTLFLGDSLKEADGRAMLDLRLRAFRQKEIFLRDLVALAEESGRTPYAKVIFGALNDFISDGSLRLPGEWAVVFGELLRAVGFPGDQTISSSEYQMLKGWHEKLIPTLASLDQVSQPISRNQALGLLRRLAAETEFQIQSEQGPVKVIGLLESAGLDFDHLWVMGASEDALPTAAKPNPFLPTTLQLIHKMPHSGPDRELHFAQNIYKRLRTASPRVVFSYPKQQGDCELRPSPLITDLPVANLDFALPQDALNRLLTTASSIEEVDDTKGPMLRNGCGEGGTTLIKDQALCPFRAFAHSRLSVRGMEKASPGLDPRTRGDLLHKTLEYFWVQVKDQATLLAIDSFQRPEFVHQHAKAAIEDYFSERTSPSSRVLELEAIRITELVVEWLTRVEDVREPFEVEDMEQERFEQIGPLHIKTFIDRIDRTKEGKKVVLDYKTGKVKLESLLSERLLEPQLPIYTLGGEADAVAFAQVRRGECKVMGVARAENILPKIFAIEKDHKAQALGVNSWKGLLSHWQTQLDQLATDFVAGVANVDPVDFKTACQYCDLAPLCRVAETVFIESEPAKKTA